MHLPKICMSIKGRLALLLGVLLVAFLLVLQALRHMESNRADELRKQSVQESLAAVQQWINLTNQPLLRFTQDFSQWNELAGFMSSRDPKWAESNLKQNLANYEIHALWALDANGKVIYAAQQKAAPLLPAPFDPAALVRLSGTSVVRHFFTDSRDGLLEVWAEPVGQIGAGSTGQGWLLVSRLWNNQYLSRLGRLVDARLQLVPAGGTPLTPPTQAQMLLPFVNIEHQPLQQLQVQFAAPDFSDVLAADTLAARLFVIFGLLLIIGVWLSLQQWVLRPLGLITRSLAQGNTALIEPIKGERTELGQVARLVESSLAQKIALQGEIEERKRTEAALRESEEAVKYSLRLRARLARDLHDGVIQSIYAAGLGLESALSQLEPDLPGARTRLQQCRQSLNDVIRQVRGFIINGLEPEQTLRQGFAKELTILAQTMEALWPVRIALHMDPQVAEQLSVQQEVHALQIVRECISNALRHGQAKEVAIALKSSADRGVLTIRDDGRGFDPERSAGHGNGLLNLSSRASEMHGVMRLESQPGHGTVVTITFTLASSA